MRKILSIIFILFSLAGYSTVYYVSPTGNDGNIGTTTVTAWRTINKVNSFSFLSGDQILFEAGGTFYGSIIVKRSNLTFGSYGSGAKPIITGFETISGWSSVGGGKYFATVVQDSTLNLLTINGTYQIIGRTPNPSATDSGYITYTALSSNPANRIKLNTSGNYVGKILLVRQNDWRLVKVLVTAQTGDTVTFQNYFSLANGNTQSLETNKNGFGWFQMQDTSCLDMFGEWAYLNNRVYVYFGANNPNSYTVKYARLDTLFNAANNSNLTIQDLSFVGGNLYGIYGIQAQNIGIYRCNFDLMGAQAIGYYRLYNSVIADNSITNCFQTGMYIQSPTLPYPNVTIYNNYVSNIGLFPGMGSFNQNDYTGISAFVSDGLYIIGNDVQRCGIDGIRWQGGVCPGTIGAYIKYNRTQYYCSVGQDHGGIYSYWNMDNSGNNACFRNRHVIGNFISNAIGSPQGTPSSTRRANGIYMDGISGYTKIDSNIVWNMVRSGVQCNCDSSITVRGNTFVLYDSSSTYTTSRAYSMFQQTVPIGNFQYKRNISYIFRSTQGHFLYAADLLPGQTIQQNVTLMGISDSNIYNFPLSSVWRTESPGTTAYTLASWRSNFSYDASATTMTNAPRDSVLFVPNWSASPRTITLTAKYVNPYGVVEQGNIVVPPYKAYLGFYNGSLNPSTNFIISNKIPFQKP